MQQMKQQGENTQDQTNEEEISVTWKIIQSTEGKVDRNKMEAQINRLEAQIEKITINI